ncbi:hypothetical protein [Paracerasibacillus soli]|uniref:Uncharacterized protein n=1 Tax=Paracerasibacillus soli TaxID=480284 RepID=A0ABU5CSA0_9BACI|nr:hypothetical protein [Virgibacillus soli]MDY0409247.1 hypothetical protein [Virgibacillus soli]
MEKLIETAKAISNEDGKYTSDSFVALQEAIKVAESALETIETEEDLAAAIAALQSALDGLEESSGEEPTNQSWIYQN